ncbi:MAG: acetyl-CoA carboxylase biotin carboxyl carrier protein [Hyphomicrobiales bacterium]|nr:acetyl-CoA carboxylase biotin carboxyl carrier protein [Hyphomicrobiales bacterium]
MKKPSGLQGDESGREQRIDLRAVEDLARITSKYDLSEVEIGVGDLRVRLIRARAERGAPVLAETPSKNRTIVSPEPSAGSGSAELVGAVKSPMVGTAYLRASPEAKPFVEIGSLVKTGDKLLLVEAMKTFNEIVAPRPGRSADILIMDGSPVEYDQPLMIIE